MKRYTPLLAFFLVMASCQDKQEAEQASGQPPAFPVIEVPAKDITGKITYPVSIEGIVNSEVRAKIPGYITHVLVDEGDRVRKGQPLFQLETRSLTEDAAAAKANVEAAQVGVDQLEPLVTQNIIGKVQLETAKAKLAQAKAAYQSITANIGYASIKSPVDGYVGAIRYRNGSLVDPSSPLPLTTVSNTDQVYGYFSMNEADYLDFLQNTPGRTLKEKMTHFPQVQLQMANGKVYMHEGQIQAVTAQVDPATGTVSFRATFPNPEHLIANGSSGTILIPKIYNNVPVVPQESTYELQGKTYIYQLTNDSTVTSKIIDISDKIGNLYVVQAGIRAGDKIVARGAGKLHEKEQIAPTSIPFDSVANGIQPVFQ